MDKQNKTRHVCSFCGRDETKVAFLIPALNGTCICDECVAACQQIIDEYTETEAPARGKGAPALTLETLPRPHEIKALLDDYVIGQDNAKRVLSVAVYNHYKRILTRLPSKGKKSDKVAEDGIEIQKSNVLLLGPTGVGKTYVAQTLAKALKVPFAIADATTLTEAGYVGEDVENILLRLIQAADFDIELAERGIIYIDEIDKISRRGENRSITRDVSGEGVQQALLKILEGTTANVPPQGGRKHPNQEYLRINTENILFICGGAFDGIAEIIEQRRGNQTIGFGGEIHTKEEKKKNSLYKNVTPHDVIKYGLIPELVGRLPMIVSLDELDEEALMRIIREPKNALAKQYVKLFSLDDVALEFSEDAFAAIARLAIARETGARGLRAILEEKMLPLMYDIPSRTDVEKIIITGDFIDGKGDAVLVIRKPAV